MTLMYKNRLPWQGWQSHNAVCHRGGAREYHIMAVQAVIMEPLHILIFTRIWKMPFSILLQAVVLYGTGYYLKRVASRQPKGV